MKERDMYDLAEKMNRSNQELKENARRNPEAQREICRQSLKRINANAQSDHFAELSKGASR